MTSQRNPVIDLEETLQLKDRQIAALRARIGESWWGHLTDGVRAIFWKARARSYATSLRRMRNRLHRREDNAIAAIGEVTSVAIWLEDQEWIRSEEIPWSKECPECKAVWVSYPSTRPPEHDDGCGMGRAAGAARRALDILRPTPRKPRAISWRQAARRNPARPTDGPTIQPEIGPTLYILPGNRVIWFRGYRRSS